MAQPCIFCDNKSGSREHLWPKWIHERKDFGPLRFQLGMSEVKILSDPQLKAKTVCGPCNNGWMSDLETENIPIVGSMLQDNSTALDEAEQRSVAAWSVKIAMMTDSMKGRTAPNRFYERNECVNLRLQREIPNLTNIWIGRVSGMHLGCFGTDFAIHSEAKKRIGFGSATTIIAGHFVTQVVTLHTAPEYLGDIALPCRPGAWDEMLLPIWPIGAPVVHWPQAISFTNGGDHKIAQLMNHWRLGQKTNIIEKNGYTTKPGDCECCRTRGNRDWYGGFSNSKRNRSLYAG